MTINPSRARSLAFQEWVQAHHPRARRLKKAEPCCALRHGAPVKAYWKRDGTRQDPEVTARYLCNNSARWSFRALKVRLPAVSGSYCWSHLYWRCLFGTTDETEVTERLMVRTGYAQPDQTLTQS